MKYASSHFDSRSRNNTWRLSACPQNTSKTHDVQKSLRFLMRLKLCAGIISKSEEFLKLTNREPKAQPALGLWNPVSVSIQQAGF
jgi:hypothetical protein